MSFMRYDHPPELRLRKPGRIAIWNMDKIVIAIAIGVWVADVIFAIDGKYLQIM
jgi:hypothetical protein